MSETITAIIADDEAPARDLLLEYLARFEAIDVVAVCADGAQAIQAIDSHRPGLAFLDIHMPTHTGLDVLSLINHIPRVVFTTAHAEFAVRAFELNAVDYLLKPYDFARFSSAVERALDVSRQDSVDRLVSLLHDVRGSDRPSDKPASRLFLKVGERIVAVAIDRVLWLEAEGDFTRVHTADETYFCSGGLGSLEQRLDADRFLRVHRSTIVALDALSELASDGEGGYTAQLTDGTQVRVSRSYSTRVRQLLG